MDLRLVVWFPSVGREPNTMDLRLVVWFPSVDETAFPAANESLDPSLGAEPQP